MIQLNLLPDIKKDFIKAQRLKRNIISGSILVSLVVIGLVVLLAFYVHVIQRVARGQVQDDIAKYNTELQAIPELSKILTVQAALDNLPGLHEQKLINSRMFEYLKVLVPNDIFLSKLELDHSQHLLKISGTSTDFRSLNVFADTLKNAEFSYGQTEQERTTAPAFSKVTVLSASKSTDPSKGGIELGLSMEFDPGLFDAKIKNPAMSVPSITTGEGFVKSGELFSGQKEEEPTNETAQ